MEKTEPDLTIYEVFAKVSEAGSYEHQFSLLAGSPEMALVLARENFLRRRDVHGVWVVPRDAITRAPADDPDLLYRLPKSYREVSDYQYLADKWRRYHQRAITPDTMT
jgi:ring-1,2-phenylacetyl-CoA epoxidase subunit PaaB